MHDLIDKLHLYGFRKFFYFVFSEIKNLFFLRLLQNSYSQNGEDLIIDKLLRYKKKGFYIDIGAYDPDRFSNTRYFYNKGWSGINIEPNTQRIQKLIMKRPGDINLGIGIGLKNGRKIFYNLFPDTLSTFSKQQTKFYENLGFKIKSSIEVEIRRLDYIISKYCRNKKIDLLSIDTEGLEIEVLKSNNWKKFKPTVICIESYTFNKKGTRGKEREEIKKFIISKGYERVYSNGINVIYFLKNNIE